MREFIKDGVAKPDIYFLYKVDKVQCTSYQQMIRIIYLQKLNAQIDIIYIPSKKTTLTIDLFGTFWRALSPP